MSIARIKAKCHLSDKDRIISQKGRSYACYEREVVLISFICAWKAVMHPKQDVYGRILTTRAYCRRANPREALPDPLSGSSGVDPGSGAGSRLLYGVSERSGAAGNVLSHCE